ncbi:hypothetical protein B0H11DRAFT_1922157 [Mycena galericulata]|nr:hypothetical protein B0H11DRAFT_1922157 [Mycena galericulata]
MMQPLSRQPTHTSIYSSWSDSNPGLRGPTLNLHAATKPLLKFMYHRQALSFIQKNRNVPLSRTILEIYSIDLLFKYVYPFTGAAILRHLGNRAELEDDARVIVNSSVLAQIPQLPGTSNEEVRKMACGLVVNLVRHEINIPVILETNLLELLVDGDVEVTFLASPRSDVRSWACILVRNLASHETIMSVAWMPNLIPNLVSLLRSACVIRLEIGSLPEASDTNGEVVHRATHALAILAEWYEGAQAGANANLLDHLSDVLEFISGDVRPGSSFITPHTLAR